MNEARTMLGFTGMSHHTSNKSLRTLLEEDHRRIDASLKKVVDALAAEDGPASARLWATAEEMILRHFNLEDMFVFPVLESSHPDEVASLRAEHVTMKRDLADIALQCDLHMVRCEAVDRLCARLREHAAREESLAYVEADRLARLGTARLVLERLKRMLGLHPETVGMTGASA